MALLQQGISPYSGAICKEPPAAVHILAALEEYFPTTPSSSPITALAVVLLVCDVMTAIFLGKLAANEQAWQLVNAFDVSLVLT